MRSENDRRMKSRFAIHRDVRYRLLDDGKVIEAGAGYTIDLGSGGVAFTTNGLLEPGIFLELSISWPVLLNDACPMRLVVVGRVLRSNAESAVCTIDRYEFRTQSRFPQQLRPRGDSTLVRWAEAVQRGVLRASIAGA